MLKIGLGKWNVCTCQTMCGLLLSCILLPAFSANAQVSPVKTRNAESNSTANSEGEADEVLRHNNWTVGLMGGLKDGAALRFSTDIMSAVDDGNNMRVLPIVGRGMKQNILDLLYLKGVDITVTPADAFAELKKEGGTRNIDKRVHYISQLYVAAVHLIVRPEIKTLKDLEGKKVSFQGKGTSTVATGNTVFGRLGVQVEVTHDDVGTSMEKMKLGELAGVFRSLSKGDPTVAAIDPKLGFHLLPIEYDKFTDYYVPITFEHNNYPNLIPTQERVETIGSPALLAVYNWAPGTDRHRRVARFIEYYFNRFETLRKPPYQPEWKEINLGAKVPGWTRYFVAEEMLNKIKSSTTVSLGAEKESEFKEFLEWKKQKNKQ